MLPPAPTSSWRELALRWWLQEIGDDQWDLVAQQLFVEPRSAGAGSVHDDLAGWDDDTRGWALASVVDAGLDLASTRIGIGAMPWTAVPAERADSLPYAFNARPDRDPVAVLLQECADEHAASLRLEVRKVTKALTAWRAALVQENRPTASNTPFQRAFILDLAAGYDIAQSTALSMVHIADRLETTMPACWAVFATARVPWRAMQAVHAELDGLDAGLMAEWDRIAAARLTDTPVSRLRDALRRARERLQARTADDRHAKAFRDRTVRTDFAAHGMAYTTIYWSAATALAFQHQLTKAAIAAHGRADEQRGVSQLKTDIVEDLAHAFLRKPAGPDDTEVPTRRGVEPKIAILIPAMTALGHADAPPVLQGYGPIGIATALKLAGTARSWVRVLTDPVTGAVIRLGRKKYRPTKDMRTLLRLMDGGNRGPGPDRPPEDNDVDHAESFALGEEQGLTDIENLMLLARADHTTKTAREWRPRLLPDRTVVWTTRRGTTYITRPADPLPPTPVPDDLVDDDPPF